MLDTRLRLSVLTSAPVAAVETFTDQTAAAADFGRDVFGATLATTSFLYMGYAKPFGAAFIELPTPNETAGVLALSYWNGSAWAALALNDRSFNFTRSGFLGWTPPSDWASKTVGGLTGYFVRVAPSVTQSSIEVAGLGLVYADDYDLQLEFPAVTNAAFIPTGETSHVKTHVAARNQLTQDLRNKGAIKVDADGNWQNLTPWDLHDIGEVRQAATFLALAKVFFNYSDDKDDHWMAKSRAYETKYRNAIDTVKVSYDKDDDGAIDASEVRVTRVTRLHR